MLVSQPDARAVEVAPEAVARAIGQLGAAEFEARQQATRLLWEAGRSVEPALQQALQNHPNAEVRLRIQSILDDFEYGVFASTPAEVAQLVRRYRRSALEERSALWAELLRRAPLETLLAVAEVEASSAVKLQILERLEREGTLGQALELAEQWRAEHALPREVNKFDEFIARHVPYLLAEQSFEKAEQVLERLATTDKGIRDWAVYLLLSEQLDDQVRGLQNRLGENAPLDPSRINGFHQLAHLLRVRGDFLAARDATNQLIEQLRMSGGEARFAEELAAADRLLRGVLFDLQDWKALARLQEKRAETLATDVEELGFAAAFHRLAGEQEAFERTMQRIRNLADRESGESLGYCREAFFLNGWTAEAMRLLDQHDPVEAFTVRIVQQQVQEAFQAAELGLTRESRETWLQTAIEAAAARSRNGDQLFEIAAQAAQALYSLGERDEAEVMFSRLAEAAESQRDGFRLRELAESELKAGLTDRAFEHIGLALSKEPNEYAKSLGVLFSRHLEAANAWWEIHESLPPAESLQDRLTKVRKLFYRGEVDDELITQLTSVLAAIDRAELESSRLARWLTTIGETALLREQQDLARQCFERVATESISAAMHLGDMSAGKEQWQEAADWYERAWTQGRRPDALYLRGLMLTRVGQAQEGQQAIRLAKLIPLSSAARHDHLATGLARRGYGKDAAEQWDLLRRCSSWTEAQMFAAIAGLGDAVSSEEPLKAAALWEQRMLNCLQNNWFFTDIGSYVRIPHLVHQTRAKGLLAQGRLDEALGELQFCRLIWPGHPGVAEEFVPALDAAGRPAAAEIFDEAFALLDETCRVFPASAMHHNNLAWMCARCGRRLDDALTHAQRALELVPDSAQYLDTLGEVHFRRGEFDQAVAAARRCIELDPKTAFYQQQLERFLAAKRQPK